MSRGCNAPKIPELDMRGHFAVTERERKWKGGGKEKERIDGTILYPKSISGHGLGNPRALASWQPKAVTIELSK